VTTGVFQKQRSDTSKPLRLLVVNWKDPAHPDAGGAEVFCHNVARDFVEAGADVTFLAGRAKRQTKRDANDAGYAIRRVGHTYSVYPLVLLWILKHRRGIDAIIDSQNGIPFFSPLAARRRTPILLLIHHVHQEQFGLYFRPTVASVGRWLERTGSRIVYGHRAICAVSPSSRAEIRRLLELKGPIYLVPNGSSRQTAAQVAKSSVPTITCVGRLVNHKRWSLLVQATVQLRDKMPGLVVNLVGSGTDAEKVQALVDEHDLNDMFKLHGYV
jgi:glycosyltransferase involved in cell wall biosynthesis